MRKRLPKYRNLRTLSHHATVEGVSFHPLGVNDPVTVVITATSDSKAVGPRVEGPAPLGVSQTKELLDRVLNLETSAAALQSEKRDIIEGLVQCITRLSDATATSSERSRHTITKLKYRLQETEHENRRLRSQKKAVSSLLQSAARCSLIPVQPQSSEVLRQANNEDLLLCQDITLHDSLKEVSGGDSNPGLSTNSSSTDQTSCHTAGNFSIDHDTGYKHNFLPLAGSRCVNPIQYRSQPDLESPGKRFEYARYFRNTDFGDSGPSCAMGEKNGPSISAPRTDKDKYSSGIGPALRPLEDSDHCPFKMGQARFGIQRQIAWRRSGECL
ncbi:MAG: hypothetical protein M1837_001840 [Sclerophora amabilis]|nr:MAG: hypothetical protein M1837_001840 [Sclerophora amabilis]